MFPTLVRYFLGWTLISWIVYLPLSAQAGAMPAWGAQGYPLSRLELLERGGQGNPLSVKSAKNEYFLLLFELPGVQANTLTLEVKGKSGSHNLDTQVFQLRPVPGNLPQKFYWDGLVPLNSDLVYPDEPLKVVVRIKVRTGHPHGIFPYELIFRSGKRWGRQPLDLQVWKFALADDLPITILANLWPKQEWFKRYGVASPEAYERVAAAYLRSLREYKVNAIAGFCPFPAEEVAKGRPVTDFPQYTRMLDQVVQMGYRYFRLPLLPGAKKVGQPGSRFKEKAAEYYGAFSRYLKAKGWTNKAIVKIWDEPKVMEFPRVVQAYGIVKGSFPEFRTESSGFSPEPDMARVINIWAVHKPFYDPGKIAGARRQGQEIWLYANVLHGPALPPTYQRLTSWYLYRNGFTGYILWAVNYWVVDPWTTPPTPGAKQQHGDFYRRGTFYYPHPKTGMPLPTLRLETLRLSWQDYQYFTLLEKAAQQGRLPQAQFKNFQQSLAALTGDLRTPEPKASAGTRWGEMEALRQKIGEWLHTAAP